MIEVLLRLGHFNQSLISIDVIIYNVSDNCTNNDSEPEDVTLLCNHIEVLTNWLINLDVCFAEECRLDIASTRFSWDQWYSWHWMWYQCHWADSVWHNHFNHSVNASWNAFLGDDGYTVQWDWPYAVCVWERLWPSIFLILLPPRDST
jgi:hypothetical protein